MHDVLSAVQFIRHHERPSKQLQLAGLACAGPIVAAARAVCGDAVHAAVNPSVTSRDWRVRDAEGRETVCGFIAPTTRPFCDGCRRLRLTSEGRLHGCLGRHSEHDLTPLLSEPGHADARRRIEEVVAAAFAQKRGERFTSGVSSMASVGG